MADGESMFEVINENGATIGNVDLKPMKTDIANFIRVVEHLKQEMQQLRSHVQRSHAQLKLLEARVSRR
jgi:hypothetical protein